MSTEPETPPEQDPVDPQEPPPSDPEPENPPPPPPPDAPADPVVFQPATWYEVETVCLTQDRGDGQPCPNLNITTTDSPVYSNAGQPGIVCGVCGQNRTVLAATILDPQPEMA